MLGVDVKGIFDGPRGHRRPHGRTGDHSKVAQPEGLARGQDYPCGNIVFNDKASHRAFHRRHNGTLNESTNVGVKTGGSRVGGPAVRLGSMVTGDGGHDVYPGSGPLYGGNTLLLA